MRHRRILDSVLVSRATVRHLRMIAKYRRIGNRKQEYYLEHPCNRFRPRGGIDRLNRLMRERRIDSGEISLVLQKSGDGLLDVRRTGFDVRWVFRQVIYPGSEDDAGVLAAKKVGEAVGARQRHGANAIDHRWSAVNIYWSLEIQLLRTTAGKSSENSPEM